MAPTYRRRHMVSICNNRGVFVCSSRRLVNAPAVVCAYTLTRIQLFSLFLFSLFVSSLVTLDNHKINPRFQFFSFFVVSLCFTGHPCKAGESPRKDGLCITPARSSASGYIFVYMVFCTLDVDIAESVKAVSQF